MKNRVWNAALSAYHHTVQKLRQLAADESGEGGRKWIIVLIVVLLAFVAAGSIWGRDIVDMIKEALPNPMPLNTMYMQ